MYIVDLESPEYWATYNDDDFALFASEYKPILAHFGIADDMVRLFYDTAIECRVIPHFVVDAMHEQVARKMTEDDPTTEPADALCRLFGVTILENIGLAGWLRFVAAFMVKLNPPNIDIIPPT